MSKTDDKKSSVIKSNTLRLQDQELQEMKDDGTKNNLQNRIYKQKKL